MLIKAIKLFPKSKAISCVLPVPLRDQVTYFKLILYAKGARGSYQAPGSVDLDLRDGVEWSGEETQDSLAPLRKGMNRLIENISSINPSFVDLVELLTLLTTQVENLHAVSHFKHETFSALNYSQDFER